MNFKLSHCKGKGSWQRSNQSSNKSEAENIQKHIPPTHGTSASPAGTWDWNSIMRKLRFPGWLLGSTYLVRKSNEAFRLSFKLWKNPRVAVEQAHHWPGMLWSRGGMWYLNVRNLFGLAFWIRIGKTCYRVHFASAANLLQPRKH